MVLWTLVLIVVSVSIIVIIGYAFRQILTTMRTVKLEPKRIDDTPVFQCQECGSTWVDGTAPVHENACAVAYVKGESRRWTD